MKRNRIIISVLLILVVILVGVASIFVSSRVGQQQAIAPTAPVSLPHAAEGIAECLACSSVNTCATGLTCDSVDSLCKKADGSTICWVGSAACTVTATSLCVASGVKTCTPDCPTTCGLAASTISTCKDSCDVATTKACPATAECLKADLTIIKRAYLDEATNTPGNYTLKTQIEKVSKNQVFVYTIEVKNVGDATASGVVITDTLTGQKQDMLTFVDIESKCTYTEADKKVSCIDQSFNPDETKTFSFRMKVVDGAVNGDIIKNVAKVTLGSDTKTAEKDLLISTIVACDHVCTADSECGGELKCDTTSGKCRNTACLTATTCNCPAPVKMKCSETCATTADCATGLVCDPTTKMCRKSACLATADCRCITATPKPTVKPTVTLEPTILPETGILDFPGVAAFGGGLLLAVVGILLAL